MKPRSILELLQILNKELVKIPFFSGLCMVIRYLWVSGIITATEYKILRRYIQRHKPKTKNYYYPYWWRRGEKEPRHQFLEKLIKKEQKWNKLLQVLKFWVLWQH